MGKIKEVLKLDENITASELMKLQQNFLTIQIATIVGYNVLNKTIDMIYDTEKIKFDKNKKYTFKELMEIKNLYSTKIYENNKGSIER